MNTKLKNQNFNKQNSESIEKDENKEENGFKLVLISLFIGLRKKS